MVQVAEQRMVHGPSIPSQPGSPEEPPTQERWRTPPTEEMVARFITLVMRETAEAHNRGENKTGRNVGAIRGVLPEKRSLAPYMAAGVLALDAWLKEYDFEPDPESAARYVDYVGQGKVVCGSLSEHTDREGNIPPDQLQRLQEQPEPPEALLAKLAEQGLASRYPGAAVVAGYAHLAFIAHAARSN